MIIRHPAEKLALLACAMASTLLAQADPPGAANPIAATASADEADRARRPSIVFLLSDDQPMRAQGRLDPYFSTPHLDRLAEAAVVFDNAFVESSVCAVSRASFFTGQHCVRHGVNSFDTPLTAEQMQRSYSGLLRRAGYRTAFLGKYGVGHTRSAPRELCLPADQFDLWYGFQQSPSYAQKVDGEKRYLTSVMEEKAIEFMRETPKDTPFLVIMCLPEPHGQSGPWNYRDPRFEPEPAPGPPRKPQTMTPAAFERLPEAIKSSRNNVGRKRYAAKYPKYMATVRDYTARTDLAVGRIRAALREMDRADNTVVIFASDNGSMWGAHGLAGKWNMYEESIRVPLMIYDPRLPKERQGRRSQMTLNVDVAPTILALAGLPIPDGMQGRNLIPVLKDPDAQGRTDWYYRHVCETRSTGKPLPRCEGVRGERWKYIRYLETNPVQEELFDLQNDPLELENLAGRPEHAKTLQRWRARCDALRATLK